MVSSLLIAIGIGGWWLKARFQQGELPSAQASSMTKAQLRQSAASAAGRQKQAIEPAKYWKPAISWIQPSAPAEHDNLSRSHIWFAVADLIESKGRLEPAAGLYGELNAAPKTDFAPFPGPRGGAGDWEQRRFAYISTELSPAVLYHNQHSQITFFHDIDSWGLSGPTHFAMPTEVGPVVVQSGDGTKATAMSEPWIVAWFSGAKGWLFDVPWLIVLEKKPESIELDREGLTIRFTGRGGRVVAMPLYGYYKCPPAGTAWSKVLPGTVDFEIDTSSWASSFPESVAARCRWWSRVHRRFPIYLHETFSVDRLREIVTVRSKVEFIEIADDWNTEPLTFAPIAPTVALALTDDHNRFPMRVSDPVTDPFIFTPHGPYMGVVGKDSYDLEFPTLKYINEVERPELPPQGAPLLAREALTRLQNVTAWRWKTSQQMPIDHGEGNYVWAAAGDRWYPRAIPYISDPRIRENAKRSLQKYMANWVLKDDRYSPYNGDKKPYKGVYLLHGPGIGSWGELGDAGKFAENQYSMIWSYAHFTGDTSLLKDRWELIKKLDITPHESNWKGFGRGSIAEMGDEAAPPLQFARAAYLAGDIDRYNYQCYIATREFLHLFVKQRGAHYFRKLQPYHQYFLERVPANQIEAMPEQVYCSNLFGGLHGWQIDGPDYPRKHRERQYRNRWVRFSSLAVGRFFRDHIEGADLREEFEEVALRLRNDKHRSEYKNASPLTWDDSHIMPSLIRLQSLALSPPPSFDDLERTAELNGQRIKFDRWRLYPDSSAIASSIAVIRLSHPTRYDRIIPKSGQPSPFVLGLERSVQDGWGVLLQDLRVRSPENGEYEWPVVTWPQWQPPLSALNRVAGHSFTFGTVTPSPGTKPKSMSGYTSLNWNTYSNWLE